MMTGIEDDLYSLLLFALDPRRYSVDSFEILDLRDHQRRIRKPTLRGSNLEVFSYDNSGASAETAAAPSLLSRDKEHCRRSFCHLPPLHINLATT